MTETLIDLRALLVEREEFEGSMVSKLREGLAQGGPQVKARLGRTSPFAHALFGVSRGKGSVLTQSVVGSFDIVSGTPSEGQTKFAFAIGGGLDVNVSERIAIRAVQVDYLRTSFTNDLNTRFRGHQNNLRLSVGVVFK